MIQDDPSRFDNDPSPQAIAEACQRIRSDWTADEFAKRSTHFAGNLIQPIEDRGWTPPVISLAGLEMDARE